MLVIAVTPAIAQRSGLKVDLMAPVIKTLVLGYERAVTENRSFQIGFSYTSEGSGPDKYRRIGFTPELRFYFSEKPAPAGFFVAPFFQYFDVTDASLTSQDKTYTELGLGLVAGYQWIFKDRVSFSAFLGPKYQANNRPRSNAFVTIDGDNGIFVRAGLTLGIVFGRAKENGGT